MQTVLSIETSTSHASVALQINGETHCLRFISERQQNQLLFQPLSQLLKLLNGRTLDAILVGSGPASYGGSRIGMAAAQGVAVFHTCPVVAVSSFFSIPQYSQQGLQAQPDQKTICFVGDARRQSYFLHRLSSLEDQALLPKPDLLDKTSFLQQISSLNASFLTLEEQTEIPMPETQKSLKKVHPCAAELLQFWRSLTDPQQEILKKQAVEPLYLRAPFISKSKKAHPLLSKRNSK